MASNSKNQSEIFRDGEGDGYYGRNKSALDAESKFYCERLLCETLSSFKEEIHSILEVGCASGTKLQLLCDFFGAGGNGVDPSAKAVAAGNERLRGLGLDNLTLKVSTADLLPFDRNQFDLVYLGFCLYLVDRENLFAAIAEADRVLKSGGFLAIVDFDPAERHKRPYHHKEGLFSYKQQYASMFSTSGHYHLISKYSFSHSAGHFSKNSDERVSLCVLHKEEDAYTLHEGS